MRMVSMAIPLWVWHWLWVQHQHQLYTRSDGLAHHSLRSQWLYWLLSPHHAGVVQDVPRQCQPWRSGSLPVHHGLLQPHLHLMCAPHPLLYQGGALGLTVLTALGVPVWTGRTVAGWVCTYIQRECVWAVCFYKQSINVFIHKLASHFLH